MKNNGKNALHRAQHSDPPETPNQPPAMERSPESVRPQGISTEIQQMAPDYHVILISLRDQYGIESRWMVPNGEPLSSDELEMLRILHVRGSQGETRRN
jgi:hypothetical protein